MLRRLQRGCRSAWMHLWMVVTLIDRNDICIVTGLLLMAYGSWLVWPPAAFLIPGAVLLWQSLPARMPFILGPPDRKRRDGDSR